MLATEAGAIASEIQLGKDLFYAEQALKEGARLLTGGKRILEETGGFYMQPTVFAVTPDMTLAREEVFGPILSIIPFETEDEALQIANGSDYGLASAVWTSNLSRAHRMVRGIHAGVVHVNTYGGSDLTVPLGGVKQSGNGHDKSLHALDKYTDLKTAWIQL
jgi:4-(gamma-glutamylamino)butanal dehydrogenase